MNFSGFNNMMCSAAKLIMHGEKPLRVLFFNSRDQRGADVDVHLSLMRSFDARRTLPFLVSNRQAEDADEMMRICRTIPGLKFRFESLGLSVQQLAQRNTKTKSSMLCTMVASLMRVAVYVRRWQVDVIHATDRPRDALLSTILGRLTSTPNVVHMHSNGGSHLSKATMWGLRHATSLLAVSEFTRQELIQMGRAAHDIHVVYNATDAETFNPRACIGVGAGVRQRFQIPPEAPIIGIVARLIPWKGQRELIEATAALQSKYPALRLLIIGGSATPEDTLSLNDEERALRCRVRELGLEDRVIFAGHHADVRPFLSALTIFSLPSYAEPFGLAITEAMSMELPVVACHSGGVPEIITHGQNGWLVEPRSVAALCQAFDTLLSDPERRVQMGKNARERVINAFSPQRQADRVSEVYASFARRHRRIAPLSNSL